MRQDSVGNGAVGANPSERAATEFQPTLIEELCIHVYKQRKKINLSSEKHAHRPFVSVGRVT